MNKNIMNENRERNAGMNDYDTEIAISLCDEVIAHLKGMPVLTDDEEALLGCAMWTKKQLKEKEC